MTADQQDALEVLKANPEKWMLTREIWLAIHPEQIPERTSVGKLGGSIKYLPQKPCGVQEKMVGEAKAYGYFPELDPTGTPTEPRPSTPATGQTPGSFDHDIITDALLHYSASIVRTDPDRALRASFLAGQGYRAPRRGSPRSLRSVEAVEEAVPEERAQMPADMTYLEFVKKAMAAYTAVVFTYADAAKKACMSEAYLRRIVQGEATPTRATLEKVYSAIFPPTEE